ncbi:DsbC family protein, partial [Campylobacter coli]|nr:DsbC family protein [Campylobacter coli]
MKIFSKIILGSLALASLLHAQTLIEQQE